MLYNESMTEVKTGKLIVIEGASDGIGKTTQYKLLQEHFQADGLKCITHHFPTYYSYQGKAIEKYLSGEYGSPENLSPYFINNLYAYDRMITWHTKLQAEFNKGRILLMDRYTTSSLIYQTALLKTMREKKSFLNYVTDFEYKKLGTRAPDTVIFLHAPLELINELRNARLHNEGNITNDIHEHNAEYLQAVYDNAMFVAKYLGWTMINCATSTGRKMRTPEGIHAEIYQKLQVAQ